MKNWISKNYKLLIIGAFLVPIFTVALVSISHVTKWYGISNPVSWALYLSIGIEIAALSTLAAISADMGKKVYFPFGLVTLIQFIGNIYFAYSFIDIDSKSFKDWVDLVSPMVEFMGVDNTDLIGHKRFLAFFAGGMLPIISLSFLHMLVKFTEEDRKKSSKVEPVIDIEKISRDAGLIEAQKEKQEIQEKITPTEEDLKKIQEILTKKQNEIEYQNSSNSSETERYTDRNNQNDEVTINNVIVNEEEKEIKNNSDHFNLHNDYEYINENDTDNIIEPTPEEEKQNFSTTQPTESEFDQNFSIIESKNENIFQNNNDFDGFVPEPFATPEEVEQYGIDNVEEPTLESSQIVKEDEKKN